MEKFAVVRIECRLGEEGRVDLAFDVVKVVSDNEEALNIVAHRRDASRRANTPWRTYAVRVVEE